MSKKTRQAKRAKRQLQGNHSNHDNHGNELQHIEQLIKHAQHQLQIRDFAGVIDTCQHLLEHHLQKRTAFRVKALSCIGLAYGMVERYQEGYEVFTEAVSIDPTNAELWYNLGLACYFTTRYGQSVRDFERALELLDTSPNFAAFRDELRPKFVKELEASRELAEQAMMLRGPDFTLDQLIEHDAWFQRGLDMARAGKWKEAESAFRRVIEIGECQPQHSGNLGVALLMQQRYDEAEVSLKRALAFDPEYALARENLAKLPALRRGDKQVEVIINNEPESEVEQSIALFQPGNGIRPDTTSLIEKDSTKIYLGKQSPRYRFFLNPYSDKRFTRCPQCGNSTRQRKLPLAISVQPNYTLVLNKTCRYCPTCDLLIVHQDQLEDLLVRVFEESNPEIVGNDYLVIGTVDRDDWIACMEHKDSNPNAFDVLHDFKEAVTFKMGWR